MFIYEFVCSTKNWFKIFLVNLFKFNFLEKQTNSDGSPTAQLSVLVIVHGGDYGWGAGNAYNASVLAAYSQNLVVTLNYRLGIYGRIFF